MATTNSNRWGLIILTIVFLACTAGFIVKSRSSTPPPEPTTQIKAEWYRVEIARGEILENKSMVGNCHLCHAYWVPIPRSEQTSIPRFAHANLELNHGSNDRCYNCHHIRDRNKYVADDGSEIMVQTVNQLCSRCHGLIYLDWLSGTHGKWTGHWNPSQPSEQSTFNCTECHDPHDPVFKYQTTAPPPVWADKFIRTKAEDDHHDPWSNFLISEEPKEIF